MFILTGYVIKDKIFQNNKIILYRGCTVEGSMPVIIKVLKEKDVSPAGISELVNECEITRNLEIEGIVKPLRLEKAGDTYALVMEDLGGVLLSEYIKNSHVDIPTFLDIAVQLANILGELHQNCVIHRNLRPENILYYVNTGKVKIADFSRAYLSKNENAMPVRGMLGTAENIPLNQTVCTEGILDYCSDYYSLGAVFYEILTGSSLKEGNIANISPAVPPPLQNVILKLLSQVPDERYHSIYGIIKDLEECRRQWNLKGEISEFSPGKMDVSPRLELPSRLFGRKTEEKIIKTAFENACIGEGKFVLVSGYAGTGKTTLVNETLKPVAIEKGYFGYGKFDQLRKNIPYAPFAFALGSVIKQLMTEPKENLETWKKKILCALGRNGAVITALIPELETVIGKQPQVEELQPREAQNRFFLVFGDFIKVFAKKKHPLVIFLDDLQWADTSSLELIRYLCRDTGLTHMLFVGAYRNNEVGPEHPLSAALEGMRKDGTAIEEINLTPFSPSEAKEFVAAALNCSEEKAGTLAETLFRKTCGIPFFLGQLLKLIYKENLISFDLKEGCWQWEEQSIQQLKMPEDAAVLVLEKLQKLQVETQNILKLASCIGNYFDLKTLAAVCEMTGEQTASLLRPAVMEGLVLSISNLQPPDNSSEDVYEFLHDIVRQEAYSLLSEEEKKKAHVKTGWSMLKNTDRNQLNGKIMSILDHINRGLDLITDSSERIKLAQYNLVAGKKAKASGAYNPAVNFFRAGMELLPVNSWDQFYPLSYDLYLECAQCEYLAGEIFNAERLFDVMIQYVKTKLERAEVNSVKALLYAGTGKYEEAVNICINELNNLGIKVPANPGKLDIVREVLVYKWQMRNKSIADLAELPEIKNPVQNKVAQLLIGLILATCTSHPDLYAFAVIKAGNHAVKYGNTDTSSIGYLGYAITEGTGLGNYDVGDELGKMSISLVETAGRSFSKCIVYFTFGSLVSHWKSYWKEGQKYLEKAIQYAIESGNILIAGYSHCIILENQYLMGTILNKVWEQVQKSRNYAEKIKHENLANNVAIYGQAVSTLMGRSSSTFTGVEDIDESSYIKLIESDKAALATYYFSKMQLCYLFGDYFDALAAAEKVKSCEGAIMGLMLSAQFNFYHSLCIAAVYDKLSHREKRRCKNTLKNNQRMMKKWSHFCPENFLHTYLLVEAERARIFGRKQKAGELYDKAILAAQKNGCLNVEAVACELAARFYKADYRERISNAYISDAFHLYKKWGAEAKVQGLEREYPVLINESAAGKEEEMYDPVEILKSIFLSSHSNNEEESFDTGAIQEVLRNICEESEPSKLLENFLELALKSTNADKGYLILENDDELFIEAIKDSKNNTNFFNKPISLEKMPGLSRQVVRYVARTLEPIVVNDSKQAGIFAGDPYIANSEVKSIACVPLQLQGIPVGVLYLENSFMTGIFSKEKMELTKFLAGQMLYAKTMQSFLEQSASEIQKEVCLPPTVSLTERELEVLYLIAAGLSNKEIGKKLDMTINTVKTHIKNIYGKLQVNRRVQVVTKAKELNLLK